MKIQSRWPKKPVSWMDGDTLCISVPFTWNMPAVRRRIMQASTEYKEVLLGGPGVYLTLHFYPDYLSGLPVRVERHYAGALQIVNRDAVRTQDGCVNACHFCGVNILEPMFKTYRTWDNPTGYVYVDNNLMACPLPHFDAVIDQSVKNRRADFEQGVDPRLLSEYHARRMAEIGNVMIRLALDSPKTKDAWERAFGYLRGAGIVKANIRSYALIGFDSGPHEAWSRCGWIESHGIKVLPMWYHRLDALKKNTVTEEQKQLGWTDYERRKIMQWYYQHKEAVKS